ncbi:MAG: carbon-nitrogen hydrolase family protein [Thermoplasmataceae archaeon]
MKIALIQMQSTGDKQANLSRSLELARKALGNSPKVVIFPEYQMMLPDFSDPESAKRNSEPLEGPFTSAFKEIAKKSHTYFMINILEKNLYSLKPYNTTVFIDDMGIIVGKYRKMHLFDAYSFHEGNVYEPGREKVHPFEIPDLSIGAQICYDLRFPEPSRMLRLMGCEILTYQAGWFSGERKLETWRTLLRARAMENAAFVLGIAQCGPNFTAHSMAVSPYGDIIAEAGEGEQILDVDLDLSLISKYSADVPLLKQRRLDLYDVSGL